MNSSGQNRSLARAVALGGFASAMLAVTIVLMTWLATDRSYAERAATDFVMPVGALWLIFFAAALASFLHRNRRWTLAFAIAFLVHGLTFNGDVAGTWLSMVEYPAQTDPVSQIDSPLDAVVLLGGYAGTNRFGVPELGGDGQRLMLTAQLWHSGKTRVLICTGDGPGLLTPRQIGRQLLVSVGVPDQAIHDVGGANTKAEMAALRAFFDDPPASWIEARRASENRTGDLRVGLVTSAFHMPRALRLAAEVDLEFVPLPCAFRGAAPVWTPRNLIPRVGAGKTFTIALKETLAWLVGR
ncbi:MAG: YdcF family protein [Planctomycetota bacterium]